MVDRCVSRVYDVLVVVWAADEGGIDVEGLSEPFPLENVKSGEVLRCDIIWQSQTSLFLTEKGNPSSCLCVHLHKYVCLPPPLPAPRAKWRALTGGEAAKGQTQEGSVSPVMLDPGFDDGGVHEYVGVVV